MYTADRQGRPVAVPMHSRVVQRRRSALGLLIITAITCYYYYFFLQTVT